MAVRLAVYTDYVYRREGDSVYTERAFALFLARLAEEVEHLTIVGRLEPDPGRWHYQLPDAVEFVGLPHYSSLSNPSAVGGAMTTSVRRFWALLGSVDGVWLLGPHPFALCFAGLALVRGRSVVLGVRQDLPEYMRSRRPGSRSAAVAAAVLERGYRLLGRALPVIVVGPKLARDYRHSRRLLEIAVSLISEADIAASLPGQQRLAAAPLLTALSVGRLDAEKNPLLLAEILGALRARDPRWKLSVYGDGPMRDELARRLHELGLEEHATLHGYLPLDGGLLAAYRESDAFLHVSFTEGLPQVLFEAFAARLPVVATAVGGVPDAVSDAALLIPPADAGAAVDALTSIAADERLRERLVERGLALVRGRTIDAECRRVAEFLARGR